MVEMRIVSSFKGLICSLATLSLLGQWLLLDVNILLPFYLLDQLKTQFKRGFLMVLTTHHGYDQRSSILNLKERCGDPDLHPVIACTGLILSVIAHVCIIGKSIYIFHSIWAWVASSNCELAADWQKICCPAPIGQNWRHTRLKAELLILEGQGQFHWI